MVCLLTTVLVGRFVIMHCAFVSFARTTLCWSPFIASVESGPLPIRFLEAYMYVHSSSLYYLHGKYKSA